MRPAAAPTHPWGISSSASSLRNHGEWFPRMSAAGVTTVRLFPEWRSVEPRPGEWQWESTDALLKSAAANKLQINGVLMGSLPWSKAKIHAFPMDHLPEWSKFVSQAVKRYDGQITHWEVWNEGNAGFNDDKHTTADYARLAAATYQAAKASSDKAQIGLTVASYDPAYLQQAILAQKTQGTPNHFDFLAVHPYELADGLADPDGEIPFLWMSQLLRDALKMHAPEKANAEIWITEVGRRLAQQGRHPVSEEQAAIDLVKLYVMALAQGISCTQWFEAQDPAGEDQGFGLINREGQVRAAYRSLQTLHKVLGPQPKYLGWINAGLNPRSYQFLFEGAEKKLVLVAWSTQGQPAARHNVLKLGSVVDITNSLTGETQRGGFHDIPIPEIPLLLSGLPEGWRVNAEANRQQPFPWGGNFAAANYVSLQLGLDHDPSGIHHVGAASLPTIKFPDGSTGILVGPNQGTNFYVHPSFANLQQREYFVRVTVRRIMPGNVGFNINYAAADSQGRTPYKNRGIWFGATADEGWQTHTWHLTDVCFSKMWGFDFSFRPEQSVPFVIGKVEVSTKPF
jgi:hypothetical protein